MFGTAPRRSCCLQQDSRLVVALWSQYWESTPSRPCKVQARQHSVVKQKNPPRRRRLCQGGSSACRLRRRGSGWRHIRWVCLDTTCRPSLLDRAFAGGWSRGGRDMTSLWQTGRQARQGVRKTLRVDMRTCWGAARAANYAGSSLASSSCFQRAGTNSASWAVPMSMQQTTAKEAGKCQLCGAEQESTTGHDTTRHDTTKHDQGTCRDAGAASLPHSQRHSIQFNWKPMMHL